MGVALFFEQNIRLGSGLWLSAAAQRRQGILKRPQSAVA
jgi:hypothetical protein